VALHRSAAHRNGPSARARLYPERTEGALINLYFWPVLFAKLERNIRAGCQYVVRISMRILDEKWQSRFRLVKYAEFAIVCILFSVVYVARNQAPLDFVSTIKWTLFFVLGMIEWLLYFFLFLSLKYNFFRWWKTLRIVGWPTLSTRMKLRNCDSLREHRHHIPGPSALLFAITMGVLFHFTGIGIFLALVLIVTQQYVTEYFRKIVPPAVILLTTTGVDNQRFHASICFTIQRLRAVALLKLKYSPTDLVSIFTRSDCFRTASDELWEEVVSGLIHIAPLVVLDARKISPAVLDEAYRIISHKLTYKLIVVVDSKGERPLLQYIETFDDISKFQDVPIVREEGLLTMLDYLTRVPNRLPASDRPLCAIIQNSAKWQIIDRTQWMSV
jgi:hypothetical protein